MEPLTSEKFRGQALFFCKVHQFNRRKDIGCCYFFPAGGDTKSEKENGNNCNIQKFERSPPPRSCSMSSGWAFQTIKRQTLLGQKATVGYGVETNL